MEEKIEFMSQGLVIEGLLGWGDSGKAVAVSHPHPLYGGDMYNYVVESLVRVYRKKGYSTLRFNFRGVGKSEGSFDNGVGEQKDVTAALDYLAENGMKNTTLAGYSFGVWVNALAAGEISPEGMLMVSPPVAFLDHSMVGPISYLDFVVTGEMDEYAPPGLVEQIVPEWNIEAGFHVIPGADHFYSGVLGGLESVLSENIPAA